MSKPTHVEAAEGRCGRAVAFARETGSDDGAFSLAEAQVHASLAIAEQLERLNEQLEQGSAAIIVAYGGEVQL